jgi:hypothetical protein
MFLRPPARTLLAGGFAFVVSYAAAAQTPGAPAPKPPALTVTGTPAHDTDKGASLLSDARKALGGEDKLTAIKRLEAKGTITQVAGNQTLDGDVVVQIEAPDKLRIDEEISLPGGAITINRTQAVNATEAWDVTEGGNLPGNFGRGGRGGGGNAGGRLGGVLGALNDPNAQQAQVDPARQAALKEQQRKARQTDLARYLVAFLATTTEAPAWVGTAVTPKDEKADVLEVTTADGTVTRVFLDIETHMPLMMTYSGPAPRGGGGQGRRGQGGGNRGGDPAAAPQGAAGGQGGGNPAGGNAANAPQGAAPGGAPGGDAQGGRRAGGGFQAQTATVEMYLGDYKVENGMKMPHHITREINGEIQEEVTIKSFKFNPNFKANTFIQPKQ